MRWPGGASGVGPRWRVGVGPFVPHTHTLDADHEPADPTRPITLRALYTFGDPTGRPQFAAETRHLTLPQAATLYRRLRDSLLAAGLGATV
ncbi:hypothetical protein [Embleya sp. AB8]|uniref:hypothetical protein n=1 Tax=Embleya sp. AB8 TaxID=3156304 RepID=UPI003C76B403